MVMRTHVVRSAQLVATVGRLRGSVEAIIRHHHENFDGSGYPDGIANHHIPIGARIIMVADTLDAMTRDRKSTRLNSSHGYISYAVFCLKKKTRNQALHGVQADVP